MANRDKVIQLRVTESEHVYYNRLASEAKMSVSDLIRMGIQCWEQNLVEVEKELDALKKERGLVD